METKVEYCISDHKGKYTVEVFESLEDAKSFYMDMEDRDAYKIFEIVWQGTAGNWCIVSVFPIEEEIF